MVTIREMITASGIPVEVCVRRTPELIHLADCCMSVSGSVSLELLPAPDGGTTQPAATYALSPEVRLAAYEPCATSARGPRIRYLRRDATGRIVADVMLHRASGR